MSQSKSRLAGIHARAEQFKLKHGLQLAVFGWGRGLDPQTALPHTEVSLAIWSKLIFEGRQFCGPNHIEPIRIVLLELIARVHHCKTVDLECALALAAVVLRLFR